MKCLKKKKNASTNHFSSFEPMALVRHSPNTKNKKPRNSFLKKALKKLGTTLTPTSSSLFMCEIAEKPPSSKHIEQTIFKENTPLKFGNRTLQTSESSTCLKNKPLIVRMAKPTKSNNDLKNMFGQCIPINNPEVNLLKCLTSSSNYVSNVKNYNKKNRFLKGNFSEKTHTSEKPKEKVNTHSQNVVSKINRVLGDFQLDSKDYFIIHSTTDSRSEIAKVFKINDSNYLFSMKSQSWLYFLGVVDLQIVNGCIDILGHSALKPFENITVHSLQGSSHLFIKASTVSTLDKDTKKVLFEQLMCLGLSKLSIQKLLKETETNALFIIKRNRSSNYLIWPAFVESHLSFSLFPPATLLNKKSRDGHSMEYSIGCIFQDNLQELGFKEFIEVPQWSFFDEYIVSKDLFKTVLCGGKSVGKSSFLRYLVNKCLQVWDSVLVIDCDLGQCEFTLPGCVSVTRVDQPLLGPNYSHLKEPLRCVYLGEVDVTKCPESYIEGYKLLINYAKREHGSVPWLINTMGFTKGFGVKVACDIIKNVNPTHVIQIESKDRKLNFPQQLEPAYVFSQNTEASNGDPECLNYHLHVIPSGSESGSANSSRGLSPAESRNLVILSYLSGMLSPNSSNLSEVIPLMTNMEQLELQVTNKCNLSKVQVAAAMNANLVALCHSENNELFPNCLGFGIVRAIDWQTNTLYLITPVATSSLAMVNCLLKGNIVLPESLYFNQGEVEGRLPYLALTSGNATARFAKRDFRSLPTASTFT